MRLYRFLLNLSFFTFVFLPKAEAQVWELGAQVGGAGYMGDMNLDKPLKFNGIHFAGFVKANLDENWALSFNYNFGKISANDSESSNLQFQQRNLSFYSNLHEFSFMVDFNFTDYFAGGGSKAFSPYIFTGLGVVAFNPKTMYKGNEYELKLYSTEGQSKPYSTIVVSIPIGGGLKYNFSNNWSLLANIGYHIPYTDYLDDVSGLYPDAASAFSASTPQLRKIQIALSDRSGEKLGKNIGVKNTQRGDFRKRDTYMFVGLGISYTFVSQKCF